MRATEASQLVPKRELVERYVSELATCGAYGETGVVRPVYSEAWREAQEMLAGWFADAGLEVRRDAVGNVWGRLPGTEAGPSIVTGSHVDSQVPGGRFDGAIGIIAGLVALDLLRSHGGSPRSTLEVVSLCEEEGSRFPGANFWGTRAITGQIAIGEQHALSASDGMTIAGAMQAAGLDPTSIPDAQRSDMDVFLELHIEQGPLLEDAGVPLGVVTTITGLRHYVVELVGRCDHAGAMPMTHRRDPVAGAAEIAYRVTETARQIGPPAVATIGQLTVEPNLAAAIAERVVFTIDARHPNAEVLNELYAQCEEIIRQVASDRSLKANWTITHDHEPCNCDPELVQLLQGVADEQRLAYLNVHSGGGHDAQRMSKIARVAMVFVRSAGGRSHTPEEFTTTDDIVLGAQLLAGALYRLAY